ncbi:MAG: alpha/beta hydrolase-fold protein [Planctomycetota bacterium]
MTPIHHLFLAACLLQGISTLAVDEKPAEISTASSEGAFKLHTVRSAYQAGTTRIRVLLPAGFDRKRSYRVLYVLPVEALDGKRWGNGLKTVYRDGLHDKYDLICVAPSFSHLPWYADHPDNPRIRQESYLLKVILPFIEKTYPVTPGRSGRLLVGFSKSGWGAFTLLLRNPKVFGAAAAFDAPMALASPGPYKSGPVFGGKKNFEKYRVESLLKKNGGLLGKGKRLALLGYYGNFRSHHLEAHGWMDALKIKHHWRDGPKRKHSWGSGWLPEAVALLAAPAEGNQRLEKKKTPAPGEEKTNGKKTGKPGSRR